MVNEFSNTISEVIGNIEKLIAITEHLKISIQDGMDNISDETQKKQVLDAVEIFTNFQRSYFKIIQATEKLGTKMNSNLNVLYSILPSDVLTNILGENNNFEDLPEDLISEIMGDESNNMENVPVDDSIHEVSVEKKQPLQKENDLMDQIMELGPKTASEDVTPQTEVTETANEVVTPPVEFTPEATSESATPPVEATPETATSPVEATPEATSEVATSPVEATPEVTSEVSTPQAETTPETAPEVATSPVEAIPEATTEVITPSTEATNAELDSIVLPSLDETSSEISTDNNTVESTSSINSDNTVLLPLSDEKNDTVSNDMSTENTEESFALLPLELDNSENDKNKSNNSDVVLSLDSSNSIENKKENSMIGESELVLPVLQQSLDVDENSKGDIASLDTSPVHERLTFISRGNPKLLAVTSKQFSKLNNSLVSQMGNPEVSHVLKLSSEDSHESSLNNIASLGNDKETDLESMMNDMEKAYSEGRVDEAERLSEEISKINAHQKTLTLSDAA